MIVVTDEELIEIYKYFQLCCLPSIVMARYAYLDYIKDIQADKAFYRHKRKQYINRIGKELEMLPRTLMDINHQNVRYMNILGDNIDGQFDSEKEELHRAIYITFRNAKMKHLDCLSALHFISAMLNIATVTFEQCCKDMIEERGKDPTEGFDVFNLQGLVDKWDKVLDEATRFYGYDKECKKKNKKAPDADLNNIRCIKAINAIRSKLSDINTLDKALREAYPWSACYDENIPYEWSEDYQITHPYVEQTKEQ